VGVRLKALSPDLLAPGCLRRRRRAMLQGIGLPWWQS
jgi:hypothetical protein